MLEVPELTTFAGFGKPRSFLYLAPVVALLVTLYLDRWIRDGRAARAGLVAAALSVAALACIGEIDRSAHPFKRNAVVPFEDIFSFVERNKEGRVLVLSTDPVVPWVLERRNTGDLCTGLMQMARQCLADGRRYDTIFVVSGHSDRSGTAAMARYEAFVRQATAGRTKRATLGAGLDEDAPLKTRLTGVPLSRTILTVDVYR